MIDALISSLLDLRITKHTELGNNDSIKISPPTENSSRRMSKREKNAQAQHKYASVILYFDIVLNISLTCSSATDVAPHSDPFTMNFSKLKKAHHDRVMPELKEEDLEESFVRGMSFLLVLS